MVGPDTVVISFQNGVLKDEMLAKAFGPERIMGGVCYVATSIAKPGVIARVGPLERLVFGEFDGKAHAAGEALPRGLSRAAASMPSSPPTSAARSGRNSCSWSRCPAPPRRCAAPIGPIRENPQTRQFFLDLMREVVAVGRAHGVDLPETMPSSGSRSSIVSRPT